MGAGVAWTFWHVTLPILRPSLFAAALLRVNRILGQVIMVIFIGGGAGTDAATADVQLPADRDESDDCRRLDLLLLVAIAIFGAAEGFRLRGVARRSAGGSTT